MTYRLIVSLIKILLASLLLGVALSSLDITPDRILQEIGLTPDQILDYARRGIRWAVPHIILGSLVVVPIWLVMYLLRPPSGE